ncbi:hypothetical protein llap_4527 [Limosa lapponica baueri]|uniref:Uncharacterized protein n=1 Tax=Limosa lapponica baueri TaxID=1758121 RepID=A0A2I0UGI6_LIMLA|nr:hypothetical protein llap_4527 [Limosa lapponica baueri]
MLNNKHKMVTVRIGFEYVLTLVKLTYVAVMKAVDQTQKLGRRERKRALSRWHGETTMKKNNQKNKKKKERKKEKRKRKEIEKKKETFEAKELKPNSNVSKNLRRPWWTSDRHCFSYDSQTVITVQGRHGDKKHQAKTKPYDRHQSIEATAPRKQAPSSHRNWHTTETEGDPFCMTIPQTLNQGRCSRTMFSQIYCLGRLNV